MLGVDTLSPPNLGALPVGHAGGVKAPAAVFNEIFRVFLGLGTLVGVVVVAYTLYNAYKYRAGAGAGVEADVERPEMGELPTGGGGGKKLALSFTLSAAIVLGLIIWTYATLLYIEGGPSSQQAQLQALSAGAPVEESQLDPITIDVIGHRFSWEFVYPNGATTTNEMRVPKNRLIRLNVTSADVFHNIGVPELRMKADAVPGQQTTTWFVGKEIGTYEARCYELCGTGHSYMTAEVNVTTQNTYDQWYEGTAPDASGSNATASNETGSSEAGSVGSHSLRAGGTAGYPSGLSAADSAGTPSSPTAADSRDAAVTASTATRGETA